MCDNVAFTLLNITDHSVVINKLQQDRSGQTLRCSGKRFCGLWSAWYHGYLFYGRLQYSYSYWGGGIYFHLQNLLLCINGTNCRLVLWSWNWERYFCVSCWYVLESNVSIITTILGVSFYFKTKRFFFISVRVTSVFFSDNGIYISRMQALQCFKLFFTQSYVPLSCIEPTGVASTSKVKKTQPSENIFAYLFGDSS